MQSLLAARNIEQPPPPTRLLTRWARLAAQVCYSPKGFVCLIDPESGLTGSGVLSRSQEIAAGRVTAHVLQVCRPVAFVLGRPWEYGQSFAGLMQIAAPMRYGPDQLPFGVIGVVDVTLGHPRRTMHALSVLAEAYADQALRP